MLNLERLRNAVLQATGFDDLPEGFTLVDTVNEAHQQWATEATWGYLEGRTYVARVTGESLYELPDSVGEVLEAWVQEPYTGRIDMLPTAQFERYKALPGYRYEIGFYGTIRWQPSSSTDPETRAVLELYPAPTNTAHAVTVIYRGTAVRIDRESDVLDMPVPLEPVFLEYFRAYCRGTMLPERVLTNELAAVRQSPMFRSALSAQTPYRVIDPTLGDAGRHYAQASIPFDYEPMRRYT